MPVLLRRLLALLSALLVLAALLLLTALGVAALLLLGALQFFFLLPVHLGISSVLLLIENNARAAMKFRTAWGRVRIAPTGDTGLGSVIT